MNKPEEWKISLADGSKQVAWYTQPLDIEVAGRFCELKFIILDHERVDVLLGLEWMKHFDVKFRPKSIFPVRFPVERVRWHDDLLNTVKGKVNGKHAIMQINARYKVSSISRSSLEYFGIKSIKDANGKLIIEDSFEVSFQTRRLRLRKLEIDDSPFLSLILGRDVIEKLDIEVDEYDFRNMFFGEVKVRTDEDYEMEEDFPAALSEMCTEEDEIDESDLGWVFNDTSKVKCLSTWQERQNEIDVFLSKHEDAFANDYNQLGECTVKEHQIKTNSETPIRQRPYKTSHADRLAIREEIKKMLDAGVIRESQSEWSSPVVMVKKKGTSNRRMCVDMRGINRITPTDPFPLPRIEDLLGELNQHKIFSTLDLKSGYWQIKLHPNSIAKSAFSTPDGHYEFLRLPFGLNNAPADFQRIMQIVLGGLSYVQVYIDDIVIYSKTLDEHFLHLEEVFIRLKKL
jgi:hypothetical protein